MNRQEGAGKKSVRGRPNLCQETAVGCLKQQHRDELLFCCAQAGRGVIMKEVNERMLNVEDKAKGVVKMEDRKSEEGKF